MSTMINRRRGNPKWCQLASLHVPVLPTEFEVQVKSFRLGNEQYVSSTALKLWCQHNRNRVYVPEWLLKEWGMQFSIIGLLYLTLHGHLVDKIPVSELCEELGLRPTVFYRWQKKLFENGAATFQSQERPQRQVEERQKRIEFLEKKMQTKDEVLAELMAEHIALKEVLANSNRQLGAARCAGSSSGFRPTLVGEGRDRRRTVHPVAGCDRQQVL